MNIFVGNIATQVSDQELEDLFKEFGDIKSVKIIRDMFTQASKGFGFVEMKEKSAAEEAIKELNTKEIGGKKLVVNEARPQMDNRRKVVPKSGGSRRNGNRR
ncbi:MAG: RNA-binding protein [Melioribacteraceae bacterium]|jgi:RNA recognition motif-containing protein|nr:RNA-binding protein [Melioribacteraceae bacterium]